MTIAYQDVTGALGFIPTQQGTGIAQNANNVVKIGWNGSDSLKVTVDSSDIGIVPMWHGESLNLGAYADIPLWREGTLNPTVNTFGANGDAADIGMGFSNVARHHFFPRLNATVTDQNGSPTIAGKVIAGDGITGHVGGCELDAVAELRSDTLVFDKASTKCTNPNAVAYQARMFVKADGAASGGNMSFFSLAGYTGGDGNANNCNLAGFEFDVGRTGSSASGVTRNGGSLVSIGNTFGDIENGYDSALNICTGPQYNDAGQTTSGWGIGILFSDLGSKPGLQTPINPNGYLMKSKGNWSVKSIFDFSGVTPTDAILRTNSVLWTTSTLTLSGLNQGMELGNTSSANTPYVDFHSSGNPTDYDARIIVSGGTTSIANGDMSIMSGSLRMPSKVGFGVTPVSRPTVTGSRGGNAALASLLSALASLGLITNSTTA